MAFPDLVILLPGITGSVLANKKGEDVWGASAGVVWRADHQLGRIDHGAGTGRRRRRTTALPPPGWCPM